MIDWKKFEHEVPTQNLGIVCAKRYEDDWFLEALSEGELVNAAFLGADLRKWAREEGWTHWAYVDPPEESDGT